MSTDEEVIRRRLLIDGDGTGDDRKLNVLLKKLLKWANSSNLSEAENQQLYDSLLAQLSQCEFSVKRAVFQEKTNAKQLEKYKELQTNLENTITKTKSDIENSKVMLAHAKVTKQHRMMYDLLAQNIKEQPDRKETNKRLDELQKQLSELEDESRAHDQKLNLRKKQFHVLVSSANQLRGMLEEANMNEELMSSSLDDITNSPNPELMSD